MSAKTGVGKTLLLELIANVLRVDDVDHHDFATLDHNNEQGGSKNQSRIDSARVYELTSKNGIMVSVRLFEWGR